MVSNQSNDGNASFGGRVPVNVKSASKDWAGRLNYENREESIGESHIYRQALYEFIANHWDEAPEEVREQIDREWLKSQIDGGLGIDL